MISIHNWKSSIYTINLKLLWCWYISQIHSWIPDHSYNTFMGHREMEPILHDRTERRDPTTGWWSSILAHHILVHVRSSSMSRYFKNTYKCYDILQCKTFDTTDVLRSSKSMFWIQLFYRSLLCQYLKTFYLRHSAMSSFYKFSFIFGSLIRTLFCIPMA